MGNQIGFGEVTCYAEFRLNELVKERMKETGETQQCAEISIVRTEEGKALWEESRRQSIGSSGHPGDTGSQKARADDGIGLGGDSNARSQLSEMVKRRIKETGETQQCAEANVIRTDEGRALWELAREASMEKL